jgi:hypothetical protein
MVVSELVMLHSCLLIMYAMHQAFVKFLPWCWLPCWGHTSWPSRKSPWQSGLSSCLSFSSSWWAPQPAYNGLSYLECIHQFFWSLTA